MEKANPNRRLILAIDTNYHEASLTISDVKILHCLVPETTLSLNVSVLRPIPLACCQENLEG